MSSLMHPEWLQALCELHFDFIAEVLLLTETLCKTIILLLKFFFFSFNSESAREGLKLHLFSSPWPPRLGPW